MINNVVSDAPVADPSITATNLDPPKQPLRKNRIVIYFLLGIILVISIIVVFLRNSQSQKSENKTPPSSQTPSVNLKTDYQNPFDKSAQYENPFENLK